jgi:hypothetical protein
MGPGLRRGIARQHHMTLKVLFNTYFKLYTYVHF